MSAVKKKATWVKTAMHVQGVLAITELCHCKKLNVTWFCSSVTNFSSIQKCILRRKWLRRNLTTLQRCLHLTGVRNRKWRPVTARWAFVLSGEGRGFVLVSDWNREQSVTGCTACSISSASIREVRMQRSEILGCVFHATVVPKNIHLLGCYRASRWRCLYCLK